MRLKGTEACSIFNSLHQESTDRQRRWLSVGRRHVCYYSTSRGRTGLSRVINVEHPGRWWAPARSSSLVDPRAKVRARKIDLSSSGPSKVSRVVEERSTFHSFRLCEPSSTVIGCSSILIFPFLFFFFNSARNLARTIDVCIRVWEKDVQYIM